MDRQGRWMDGWMDGGLGSEGGEGLRYKVAWWEGENKDARATQTDDDLPNWCLGDLYACGCCCSFSSTGLVGDDAVSI